MKEAQKKFLKVFAALLPAAPFLDTFPEAFYFAAFLGAGALFVIHLFLLLKPLFPPKLFRFSVVLFLAVFFQIIQQFFNPSPFWVVSLVLLLDRKDYEAKHLGFRPLPPLVRVGIFWCGALFLGMIRGAWGGRLEPPFFDQPAGTMLALALFSALILNLEKLLTPARTMAGKRRGA